MDIIILILTQSLAQDDAAGQLSILVITNLHDIWSSNLGFLSHSALEEYWSVHTSGYYPQQGPLHRCTFGWAENYT